MVLVGILDLGFCSGGIGARDDGIDELAKVRAGDAVDDGGALRIAARLAREFRIGLEARIRTVE